MNAGLVGRSELVRRQHPVVEIILFTAVAYTLNFALLRGIGISRPSFLFDFVQKWGALYQMWIPGLVSIVFRLAAGRGFKDVGWRLGASKYWLSALLIALAVPALSYLGAFAAGVVSLNRGIIDAYIYSDPLHLISLYWPANLALSAGAKLAVRSLVIASLGLLVSMVFAFGEELGWRGYLQQRILETRFPWPYALCGLIWAGWHMPFLWFVWNPSRLQIFYSVVFTVNVILLGIIAGRLRVQSGSIWIPTLLHAAHNTFNFELFAMAFGCEQCDLFIGETGVLMGVIYGIIVFLMLKKAKTASLLRPLQVQ